MDKWMNGYIDKQTGGNVGMDGYEEVAPWKLKGPKVPTEWYTILIIAGKEAEYRARPIWCQDGVDTDTNSNTVLEFLLEINGF